MPIRISKAGKESRNNEVIVYLLPKPTLSGEPKVRQPILKVRLYQGERGFMASFTYQKESGGLNVKCYFSPRIERVQGKC